MSSRCKEEVVTEAVLVFRLWYVGDIERAGRLDVEIDEKFVIRAGGLRFRCEGDVGLVTIEE